MATTHESQTVKAHFAAICAAILPADVTNFAGELLEAELIGAPGHRAAIEPGVALPSDNKIANLVSEVMTRVAGSQDKFAKFVSVLESRNKKLAETLRRKHASRYETDHESTGRCQHGAGHEGNTAQLTPADQYSHFTDASSQSDAVTADSQATTTGNKRPSVADASASKTTPAAKKPCPVSDDVNTDSQSTTCAGRKRPSVADAGTTVSPWSLTTSSAAKKTRSDFGPNTATDSQTTPPPPAAKEAYSILAQEFASGTQAAETTTSQERATENLDELRRLFNAIKTSFKQSLRKQDLNGIKDLLNQYDGSKKFSACESFDEVIKQVDIRCNVFNTWLIEMAAKSFPCAEEVHEKLDEYRFKQKEYCKNTRIRNFEHKSSCQECVCGGSSILVKFYISAAMECEKTVNDIIECAKGLFGIYYKRLSEMNRVHGLQYVTWSLPSNVASDAIGRAKAAERNILSKHGVDKITILEDVDLFSFAMEHVKKTCTGGAETSKEAEILQQGELETAQAVIKEKDELLEKERETAQAAISERETAQAMIKEKDELLEKERETAQAAISERETAQAMIKEKDELLEKERETAQAAISEREIAQAMIKEKDELLEKERETARAAISERETAQAMIKEKDELLEKLKESAQAAISERESAQAMIKEKDELLEKERETAQEAISERETAQAMIKEKDELLEKERETAQAMIKEKDELLEKERELVQEQLLKMHTSLTANQDEINDLQTQGSELLLQRTACVLHAYDVSLRASKEKERQLQSQLATVQQESHVMEQQLSTLGIERTNLLNNIGILEYENKQCNKHLQRLQKDYNTMLEEQQQQQLLEKHQRVQCCVM